MTRHLAKIMQCFQSRIAGRLGLFAYLVLSVGCTLNPSGSSSLFGQNDTNLPFKNDKAAYTDQATKVKMQLSLADQHYQSAQYTQAAELYLEVLKVDQQQPQVYYRLGNIAFRQQQLKRASYYFQKSLELDPMNSKTHYNLAATNLSLAERHFKFYTANLPPGSDVSHMTQILGAIEQFSGKTQTPQATNELDRALYQLTDEL